MNGSARSEGIESAQTNVQSNGQSPNTQGVNVPHPRAAGIAFGDAWQGEQAGGADHRYSFFGLLTHFTLSMVYF